MNDKIYLPVVVNNNQCAYISQRGVIRVYDSRNTNTYVNYTDYYIEDSYLSNTGTSYIGNNYQYNCINTDRFTTDYMYRHDLPSILIILAFILIFLVYFPFKLVSRMFGRWLKI